MFRLLHIADVHLDAPLGGFGRDADDRRAEVLEAFRALSGTAADVGADAVLIAGDLFDGPRPSERTVIAVRETVRRMVDAGIPVFAVPGNHDARALNPSLYPEALDGAVCFTEPRFGEPAIVETAAGTLHVYGVAYDAAEEADPLATFEKAGSPAGFTGDGTEKGGDADDGADEGGERAREGVDRPVEGAEAAHGGSAHVVLLHGSVPGAPHWGGGSSLPLPLESLRALDADYVALGDLHRFRDSGELDGIPACYPGSFAAVDLTEAGLRGPVVVELTPGRAPVLERLASGVREVSEPVEVDVSPCTTDLEVADEIERLVGPDRIPSVDLHGEPAYPLDPDAIRAILDERFGAAGLRDRSRFFEAGRLEELADENTVAGHVARIGITAIEAENDEAERAFLEQGLRIALRVLEV